MFVCVCVCALRDPEQSFFALRLNEKQAERLGLVVRRDLWSAAQLPRILFYLPAIDGRLRAAFQGPERGWDGRWVGGGWAGAGGGIGWAENQTVPLSLLSNNTPSLVELACISAMFIAKLFALSLPFRLLPCEFLHLLSV